MIDTVWGPHFTLICYFAVQWRWRLCVDLRLLNVWNTTGVVLALNQQMVRLHCYVCLNLKMLVISVWCSQYEIVIHSGSCHPHACTILLSKYTTMAMTSLRWSSFVVFMERCCVGRAQTGRTFVLLRVRLNLNEGFTGVRCSIMRS